MNCKICNSHTNKVFTKIILKKYECDYYHCTNCGFMQTSEPVWLNEAYSSAITTLDIGLVNRNLSLSQEVPRILDACFPSAKHLLDYAAGYGMFVRLMRDEGFDFYHYDPFCENLFAQHFSYDLQQTNTIKFDVVTAFEVFEHFKDPIPEIEKLFGVADSIIFSTQLLPDTMPDTENWWYISPETGQHIAFYSRQTMKHIASKYNKNYYHKGHHLHVFTSKQLSNEAIDYAFNGKNFKSSFFGLLKKYYSFSQKRSSLIEKDYQYIKNLLNRQ